MRQIVLTPTQRDELLRLRDTAPKPYLRERAAALLKVADGTPGAAVARRGLLRPRQTDTIYAWLTRFEQQGVAGLLIRPGRGRKPAFSPSAPPARRGEGGAAPHRAPGSAHLGGGSHPLDPRDAADHR
jgi:hypothetical protein